MSSTWVANASPLIALGSIGCIDVLPSLCADLLIPEGVAQEVARGPASDPARAWVQEHGQRFIHAMGGLSPVVAAWDLGLGESQVLSVCCKQQGREAILDDRAARRCATALGVPARGTLAVIILAKRRGLIPAVRPLFDELAAKGFHADSAVLERALHLAGE